METQPDEQFQQWVDDRPDQYADEVFIEDLAEELEPLDDEEEKERRSDRTLLK